MKLNISLAAIAIGLSLAACSQKSEEQPETTAADALIERLTASTADGKILFGHHDDPVYGRYWAFEHGRSDVLESAGGYPALMSWDLGRMELGDTANLDGVPFSRMRAEVIAQDARGGVNTFSWHLFHPITGADSWQTADTTLVSALVDTAEGQEAYRQKLRLLADWFKSLTDADGNPIGVIFRPWHEHTGGWFWWGTPNCSNEDYKALWTIMREEFDHAGVDNIVWAYSPDRIDSAEKYMERYPGDMYVDIMGADVYHFNDEEGTEAYRHDASTVLAIATKQAKEHEKLVAFTETGLEGLTITDWYTRILLPILKEYPVSYVTVWRNAIDNTKPGHFYAPHAGNSSVDDFKSFTSDPKIVIIKE